MTRNNPLRIAIIAGEHSGDSLGASLVQALRKAGSDIELSGVGDEKLAAQGQASYFPQADIAVMGIAAVVQRLPLLIRRINETAQNLIAEKPDMIVTIDSPDFNFRVAQKVRAAAPHIPIVHWVCPSVWAWRPWRARTMRKFIDHVLCLLPFEPNALRALKGPPGTYVGHPLIERVHEFRPQIAAEVAARDNPAAPQILILPGSRRSIATRLLPIFSEVAMRMQQTVPDAEFIVPTVAAVQPLVENFFYGRNIPVRIVADEPAKLAAFRSARAALAASGTVTLELALAQVPTVAAYRVAEWEAMIARRAIRVPSVLLPNLVLGTKAVPEMLQENCTADTLVAALVPLLANTAERAAQLQAFMQLDEKMSLHGIVPSEAAAQAVLACLARRHSQ